MTPPEQTKGETITILTSYNLYNEFIELVPKPEGTPQYIIDEWQKCISIIEQTEHELSLSDQIKTSRYCKAVIFKREMKESRAFAKQCGYRIIQKNLPINWYQSRPNVSGSFHKTSKNLYIKNKGKNGNFALLFVLYHELRHLQHSQYGIFPDYYNDTFDNISDYLFNKTDNNIFDNICSPYEAIAAELDCNLYATQLMNKKQFYIPQNWRKLYIIRMVYMIHFVKELISEKTVRSSEVLKKISSNPSWGHFMMSSPIF